MPKRTPGAKVVARNVEYKDWIAGENALRFATREQVVAFANLQLREQIVPLIRNAIIRYDRQQRAKRWYLRLLRWLLKPWRPTTAQEQVQDILAEAAEEESVVGTIGGTGRPDDNGEVRKSCVTCGSFQLEPVNERGGLQCDRGHIIEEPPPETTP